MRKKTVSCVVLSMVLIGATLYLGTRLTGRWYYLTSTLVLLETMLPFFVAFENRKPQARELVTLAVLSALAVASRVLMPIPNFKMMTGILMITGIALGPEAGFIAGSMTAFTSNFFLSHGPWTPWQMMAYGVSGFLAGALFHRRFPERRPWVLGIFGFLSVMLVVGPLLDCCTVFTVTSHITKKYVLSVFAAGLLYNFKHAVSTGLTMALLSGPMLRKLDRLKRKYGMLESEQF